jgi:hypothetical protein
MRRRRDRHRRRGISVLAVLGLVVGLMGCQPMRDAFSQTAVRCGRFEGPGCNELLALGLNAVASFRADKPAVVAIAGACPDNARCLPSALGGEEVAVVVAWPDRTMRWVTIPLPADWPDSEPGEPMLQDGPPPEHLQSLVPVPGRS